MTTTDPAALRAETDQNHARTLEMLAGVAGMPHYAGMDLHTAVAQLADTLSATIRAEDLPGLLANVLIAQARHTDMPPMVTTADQESSKILDPSIPGVVITVTGPDRSCRRVIARMDEGGIPVVGVRGPGPARDREDDAVRYYAYTDRETKTAHRQRNRSREKDTR